ncbi:MAG: hypothetical protein HRU17_08115 [Polyangiaceae bacterium]|nr:hypothetical protein [Polyangiaceae bacterium]
MSLLTNSRMHPDLVERIEASLGVTAARGSGIPRPTKVAMIRAVAIVVIVSCGVSLVSERNRRIGELEKDRGFLLKSLDLESSVLSGGDLKTVERAQGWLARDSSDYAGDWIRPDLGKGTAWAEMIAVPAIYVRGPIADFQEPKRFELAVRESQKDPFLLCLLEPPKFERESSVYRSVYTAYRGGKALEEPTRNVRRLRDALAAIYYLDGSWRERVVEAERSDQLAQLQQAFDSAGLLRARAALTARYLIYAIDEAKDPGTRTELDGGNPHWVRFGIVGLKSGEPLVRLRRHVDPSWVSESRAPEFSRGLNSCLLASQIRKEVLPADPSPSPPGDVATGTEL